MNLEYPDSPPQTPKPGHRESGGQPAPQRSDFEIWRAFKDGDEGAFIYIYKTYVNYLFNAGIQYIQDEEIVKDCLQDFFVELRQHKNNLANIHFSIRLYLLKSFRRKLLKEIKKLKYDKKVDLKEAFAVEIAFDEKIIDSQFNEARLQQIEHAISQLPVHQREALYYFYYMDLSYSEIAELLHYNHVSSARRLIYKSLQKMRALIPLILLIAGLTLILL